MPCAPGVRVCRCPDVHRIRLRPVFEAASGDSGPLLYCLTDPPLYQQKSTVPTVERAFRRGMKKQISCKIFLNILYQSKRKRTLESKSERQRDARELTSVTTCRRREVRVVCREAPPPPSPRSTDAVTHGDSQRRVPQPCSPAAPQPRSPAAQQPCSPPSVFQRPLEQVPLFQIPPRILADPCSSGAVPEFERGTK